ncbi:hypothetical protein EJB05_31823, partial [Eragrostis curvula]
MVSDAYWSWTGSVSVTIELRNQAVAENEAHYPFPTKASQTCRPLENAIASMTVPCAFTQNGCTRCLTYAEKRTHEAVFCQHAPCACPIPHCAYSGLLLHEHSRGVHAAAGDDATFREATATLHLHKRAPGPSETGLARVPAFQGRRGLVGSERSLSLLLCVPPLPRTRAR